MARVSLWLLLLITSLSSCQFYRRDIMFRTDGAPDTTVVKKHLTLAKENFKILPFDWIDLKVYSNNGESLVDPNSEFGRQVGASGTGSAVGGGAGGAGAQLLLNPMFIGSTNPGRYLVNSDGIVTLPLVGKVKLNGLTYRQADSLLAEKYSNYYEDAFVITRTANRRCVVLLGAGGLTTTALQTTGRVVTLTDEGLGLVEVLMLAGGVPSFSDVSQIKIIRAGNLNNPKVEVVNLQYLTSAQNADLRIFPNDIVYIEPVRRPVVDFLRDYVPLVTLPITSFVAVFLLFNR